MNDIGPKLVMIPSRAHFRRLPICRNHNHTLPSDQRCGPGRGGGAILSIVNSLDASKKHAVTLCGVNGEPWVKE
jgi:hypothetical protein